jgi:hypothetical protein
LFGGEAAKVLAPEKRVAGIDEFGAIVRWRGGLAIGGAGDDKAMDFFQRPMFADEFGGEPIEELCIGVSN